MAEIDPDLLFNHLVGEEEEEELETDLPAQADVTKPIGIIVVPTLQYVRTYIFELLDHDQSFSSSLYYTYN